VIQTRALVRCCVHAFMSVSAVRFYNK